MKKKADPPLDKPKQIQRLFGPEPSFEKRLKFEQSVCDHLPQDGKWREERRLKREVTKTGNLIPFWTGWTLENLWLNGRVERKTEPRSRKIYWRLKLEG